jgi:hypothetical protein
MYELSVLLPLPCRAQGLSIDVLPMLNHHAQGDVAALKERLLVRQPGQEYLLQLLLQQEEPVTLVMTGDPNTVLWHLSHMYVML